MSTAPVSERSWTGRSEWLTEHTVKRTGNQDPARQAQQHQSPGVDGRYELGVALLIGVPQVAWIAFLGYLALRVFS